MNLCLPAEQQSLGQHLLRNLLSQLQQLAVDLWRVCFLQGRLSLSLLVIFLIRLSVALHLLPLAQKGPRQAPGLTGSHLQPQAEQLSFTGQALSVCKRRLQDTRLYSLAAAAACVLPKQEAALSPGVESVYPQTIVSQRPNPNPNDEKPKEEKDLLLLLECWSASELSASQKAARPVPSQRGREKSSTSSGCLKCLKVKWCC